MCRVMWNGGAAPLSSVPNVTDTVIPPFMVTRPPSTQFVQLLACTVRLSPAFSEPGVATVPDTEMLPPFEQLALAGVNTPAASGAAPRPDAQFAMRVSICGWLMPPDACTCTPDTSDVDAP